MAKRNYTRLDPVTFGAYLINSGDLDPVYIALVRMHSGGLMEDRQLARWLLSYWCFYHCGLASYLSEFSGSHFWHEFGLAVENCSEPPVGERWPRGTERRHFRGKIAIAAMADLREKYHHYPEGMLKALVKVSRETDGSYEAISKAVQTHSGFGPWISFKIADMLERVCGEKVDFSNSAVFMFRDPVKGANMYNTWVAMGSQPGSICQSGPVPTELDKILVSTELLKPCVETLDSIVKGLGNSLSKFTNGAPPMRDRPIGIQEVETVLCKWKSHLRGHYPVGNDTVELYHGTSNGWGETARNFRASLPEVSTLE